MSLVEIIMTVAGGAILFILIRRLPATRNVSSATLLKRAPQGLSRGSSNKIVARRLAKMSGTVMVGLSKSYAAIKQRIGSPLGSWAGSFRRKERTSPEEELVRGLKREEDRSFWVGGSKKEEAAATSFIVATTYFEQAEEAFAGKDFRKAETLYLEAARENPHNPKIFNRLGVIYLEQQNFADAIEAFKTALQYGENIGARHFNLALAYLGQGDYQQAVKSLEKASRLTPDNEKYKQLLEDVRKKC